MSYKFGLTKLNDNFLNSMSNSWSKQAYLQGFEYKYITLKTVNMIEHMDIVESIYEGVF